MVVTMAAVQTVAATLEAEMEVAPMEKVEEVVAVR